MNLKSIKNNTSSPFRLQRSIVSQEEGAYASGGYNPNAVYNNDAANAAVEGFGTMLGAALIARGKNKKDVKKKDKIDPGLEKFKGITAKAKIEDEKQQKENTMNSLNKITDEIDSENLVDSFMGNYKKYNKK
jgi:hypothetical protein